MINEINQPTGDEQGAPEDGEGKRTQRWPDQPLGEDAPGLLQPWDRAVAQSCGLSLASGPMPTGLSSINCVQVVVGGGSTPVCSLTAPEVCPS